MFGRSLKSFKKKWKKKYEANSCYRACCDAWQKLKDSKRLSAEKRAVLISVMDRGVADNNEQALWFIHYTLRDAMHIESWERTRLIGLIDSYLESNPDKYNAFDCAYKVFKDAKHLSSDEQSLLIDIFEKGMKLKSQKANNNASSYASATLRDGNVIDSYDRARLERVSKSRPKETKEEKSWAILNDLESKFTSNPDLMFQKIKSLCDDGKFDQLMDINQIRIVRLIFTAEQNGANKAGALTSAGSVLEHGMGVDNDSRKMLISLIDRLSAAIPDLGFMWACNALNKTKFLEDHQQKKLETIAVTLLDHKDDAVRNSIIKSCANFIASNGSFENEKLNKAFARSMLNYGYDKKPPVNNRSITKNVW